MERPDWMSVRVLAGVAAVAACAALYVGGSHLDLIGTDEAPAVDPASVGAPVVIPEGADAVVQPDEGRMVEPADQLSPEVASATPTPPVVPPVPGDPPAPPEGLATLEP